MSSWTTEPSTVWISRAGITGRGPDGSNWSESFQVPGVPFAIGSHVHSFIPRTMLLPTFLSCYAALSFLPVRSIPVISVDHADIVISQVILAHIPSRHRSLASGNFGLEQRAPNIGRYDVRLFFPHPVLALLIPTSSSFQDTPFISCQPSASTGKSTLWISIFLSHSTPVAHTNSIQVWSVDLIGKMHGEVGCTILIYSSCSSHYSALSTSCP